MTAPSSTLSLWEAARREMEEYAFHAEPTVQPQWHVPNKIAINVAVAGRAGAGPSTDYPVDVEQYVDAASQVIEAGACGVHIDFTWVTDSNGRRLDKDLPPPRPTGWYSGRCARASASRS